MNNLKNNLITGSKKDRAEALAFVHAVAMPLITAMVVYVTSKELGQMLLAGAIYIFVLSTVNFIRLWKNNDEFSIYKANKFFEHLKYILSVLGLLSIFATLVIAGVHYA